MFTLSSRAYNAFEHHRDTYHFYTMQLDNNRVWNYVEDNFVHCLLQDKDKKMVEGIYEPSKGKAALDEKVDAIKFEFTYLLTSLKIRTIFVPFEG